ncbi:hypothetical protein FLJC2902T_04260 [Flavobacterium limnosediminis JC2902]|uniref:Uncharacterized protein n=1 Tax=Flavobacterium limnosediminis JC2902 TaxID=1341181 RepID=V6STZ8_9FLAO|nr:hypothetical protein FLJC2902T_04260 [Flavobacterium limnosediminis JC2902]
MGIIEREAEKNTSDSLVTILSNRTVTGIKMKSQKTDGFRYLFMFDKLGIGLIKIEKLYRLVQILLMFFGLFMSEKQ